MNPTLSPGDDEALAFADEQADFPLASAEPWRILIVDDEADVHEATRLALRDLVVESCRLTLLHAYSAREAYAILAQDSNVAVILLDVVMESEDAGLHLVKQIRNDLGRQAIRIILRTGQPGYAPEIDTIHTYDINDYKTKSELTRVRLFTSLTVAIRSYRQIRQLEMNRRGLELIVAASTGLAKQRALQSFAEGVVTQLCALLNIAPEGLVCVFSRQGTNEAPRIIATAGRYRTLIQHPLHELLDAEMRGALQNCLSRKQHTFKQGATCLYFNVSETSGIAVGVNPVRELDPVDRDLIEVFCANMSVGFENVLLHNRLYDFAYHDQLLHLPNRNRFIQFIDENRANSQMTLALVDLDDFAEMNTVLDHRFGDQVLQAVGTRLARSFGPQVILARVAGDVFGLFGPQDKIHQCGIKQVFLDPFVVQGETIRISATSSLIRLDSDSSATGEELLKDASIALKQAKLLHRGRAEYFSADISRTARARIRMLNNLRAAFSAERLFVVFQPQVELASGRVVGAEALLRWRTEDGQFVPPDQFIPLAEQSGLIIHIGEWVLRTACHQLKRLDALGYVDFRMSINVSHIQFREPVFVALLDHILNDCQVKAGQIELELTESVAMEHPDSIATKLAEIRRMGVSIALDDFGTGYSSLSVLKQLNVDRLKIDRTFVREIGSSGDVNGIATLIVALGRQLNLSIIAEGVETPEQRVCLRAMGCQEGQGYLFARPLTAKQLEAWLATGQSQD